MAALDHWHPVLLSTTLRNKPVAVRLCGQELVLFRPGPGEAAALDDCCPHRRMRLSLGSVVEGKLRCQYHGWKFAGCGAGESPGTPKLYAQAVSYDVREELGAIWVKPRDSTATFPAFDVDGYYHLCTLQHVAKAPLELVVDNFCEIEHTPTTHAMFGYPLERMHEVQVRFESTPTSVRVINWGPPKQLSPLVRFLLDVQPGDRFNDDWTTYFSPVYSVYDHWWSNPETGHESRVRWRLYIFFVPVDADTTAVLTFAFTKSRVQMGPAGGVRLFKWLMVGNLNREINLDVNILENLADKNPSIEGMKLSRFDRVLGLNRDRIQSVYRGICQEQQAS